MQELSVCQFFSGKGILITGCMGLIGKMLLYKYVQLLQRGHIKDTKLFVLIRPKKDQSPAYRMEQIFKQSCFSQVRKEMGPRLFNELISNSVVAIGGDIEQDNMGISEEDEARLTEEVNVIYHSAADVGYQSHIHDALQRNYFGALRCQELAHKCKKMLAFNFVSTLGVNWPYGGPGKELEEKMYPLGLLKDVGSMKKKISKVMQMSKEKADASTNELKNAYASTYSLSKCWAEHALIDNKRSLPMLYCRLGMIANSYKEPYLGYTDTVQVFQGIVLSVGVGALNYLEMKNDAKFDLVPVDYACNQMIMATALKGFKAEREIDVGKVEIFHQSSNLVSPVYLERFLEVMQKTFRHFRLHNEIYQPYFEPCNSHRAQNMKNFFYHKLPIAIGGTAARLPMVPFELKKKMFIWHLVHQKGMKIPNALGSFLKNILDNQSKEIYNVMALMSPEELALFPSDVKEIEWDGYIRDAVIGTAVHVLKQNHVDPALGFDQILVKNSARIPKHLLESERKNVIEFRDQKIKTTHDFEARILALDRYQQYIGAEQDIEGHKKKSAQAIKKISKELERVRCRMIPQTSRFLFKLFTQVFEHLVTDLHVSRARLEELKKLRKDHRVLFVPTNKSLLDPFLLFFVFQTLGVEHGFQFGDADDTLSDPFTVDKLKSVGKVLLRWHKSHSLNFEADKNPQTYVNSSLLAEAVAAHPFTTLFQNERRSSSGKFSRPFVPDKALQLLVSAAPVLARHRVLLVPVSLNYERPVEGSLVAPDLMAGKKEALAISEMQDFLKKIYQIKQGKLGKVVVDFLEPLGLGDYVQEGLARHQAVPFDRRNYHVALDLTHELTVRQQAAQKGQGSGFISSLLVTKSPQAQHSLKDLRDEGKALFDFLALAQANSLVNYELQYYDYALALPHMGYQIEGDPDDRRKVAQCKFSQTPNAEEWPATDFKHVYSTGAIDARLSSEGLLAQAVKAGGDSASIAAQYAALQSITASEFLLPSQSFGEVLQSQIDRGIYGVANGVLTVKNASIHGFLLTLFQKYIDAFALAAAALTPAIKIGAQQEKPVAAINKMRLVAKLTAKGQALAAQGQIRFLNSCTESLLSSAVSRLTEKSLEPHSDFIGGNILGVVRLSELSQERVSADWEVLCSCLGGEQSQKVKQAGLEVAKETLNIKEAKL